MKKSTSDFLENKEEDCDFFLEYSALNAIKAQFQNEDYNYITLADYGIDFYDSIIITSDDMIKNNEQTVQEFVHATIKGYEYAVNKPNEAVKIFLTYNPEYDQELAGQEYTI